MKRLLLPLLAALSLPTAVNANKASPEMIWLSGQFSAVCNLHRGKAVTTENAKGYLLGIKKVSTLNEGELSASISIAKKNYPSCPLPK